MFPILSCDPVALKRRYEAKADTNINTEYVHDVYLHNDEYLYSNLLSTV